MFMKMCLYLLFNVPCIDNKIIKDKFIVLHYLQLPQELIIKRKQMSKLLSRILRTFYLFEKTRSIN
jgi:hypothetical protein